MADTLPKCPKTRILTSFLQHHRKMSKMAAKSGLLRPSLSFRNSLKFSNRRDIMSNIVENFTCFVENIIFIGILVENLYSIENGITDTRKSPGLSPRSHTET